MEIIGSIFCGIWYTVLMYLSYHLSLSEDSINSKIFGCVGTSVMSTMFVLLGCILVKDEGDWVFLFVVALGFLFVHYNVFKRLVTKQKH